MEKPRWSDHCSEEIGRGHGKVGEVTRVKITHTRKQCFSSDAGGQTDFNKTWKPTKTGVFDVNPMWDLKKGRIRIDRTPEPLGLMDEDLNYCS